MGIEIRGKALTAWLLLVPSAHANVSEVSLAD
jgi:hypothetical protein